MKYFAALSFLLFSNQVAFPFLQPVPTNNTSGKFTDAPLNTQQSSAGTTTGPCAGVKGVSSFNGVGMPDQRHGGRISTFGGPNDAQAIKEVRGYRGGTGLALIGNQSSLPASYILPDSDPRVQAVIASGRDPKTIGRLNPDAFYIAARWPGARRGIENGAGRIVLTNPSTGASIIAIPVDWGPHATKTDKDFDLSPGAARALGLRNGDTASMAYSSKPDVPPGACDGSITFDDTVPAAGADSNGAGGSSDLGRGGSSKGGGYCGNDFWSSTPNCCYKHTGSPGTPNSYPGVLSCNGGFILAGDPPVPVPVVDCGPEGALCDRAVSISAGGPLYSCLLTACKPGRNAIWDQKTKVCGCDDGGGFTGVARSLLNATTDGGGEAGEEPSGPGGTTPARRSSGGRSDAENRAALKAAGINVNSPEPKTSLEGMTKETIDNLIAVKNTCGCDIMVTAGSEGGHKTHGVGQQIMDLNFIRGSGLNSYLMNPANSTRNGPNYFVPRPGGGFIRFYDEPAGRNNFGNQPEHWHVDFESTKTP